MKPLTSDTLAKAVIIEEYCWEIAAHEVANKNTGGAKYFMGLADSLHAMYELGHDGEEAPRPSEAFSSVEQLQQAIQRIDVPPCLPPSMPQEIDQTCGGSLRQR